MGLKLYYGGFGDYKAFAVAESDQAAVEQVGKKINAPFLPVTVEEISEIDGFQIRPESTELRHCKKCDFTCENQGELLAHYREKHPKGD